MSYYLKYQKYKKKYLKLKNDKIGGTLTKEQLKRCDNGINEDGNTKDHPAICVLSMEPINPDRLEDYVMLPNSKTCVKKDLLQTWFKTSKTNPFTREEISKEWIFENFGQDIEPFLENIGSEIRQKISNIHSNVKNKIINLIENLTNNQTNQEIVNKIDDISDYININSISDDYRLSQFIENLEKIKNNLPDEEAVDVYDLILELKGLETVIEDENDNISDRYMPLVELKDKIEKNEITREQIIKSLIDIIN